MIQNILIGLNGSPRSETAVELGIRWAARTQAAVVGLGIVDEPTIRRAQPAVREENVAKIQRETMAIQDAHSRVDHFLKQFSKRCGEAKVSGRVLKKVGIPAEQILLEAEDYDLTLVGSSTHQHFATQAHPDNTLDEVLRQSRRPVVVVCERLPENRPVLVIYDGSPASARVLKSFQEAWMAEWPAVIVLSVDRTKEVAVRRAEEAAKFLRFHDIPAEARPIAATGSPGNLLHQEVLQCQPGMIAMGMEGEKTLRDYWFGSATETILKESDVLLFLQR
jgi:nucleotide-binding universal stress UspA family protein